MIHDPATIPETPYERTREYLIPAILEQNPHSYIVEHSAWLKATYDLNTGWNRDRLNACSVSDLMKILAFAQITPGEVGR